MSLPPDVLRLAEAHRRRQQELARTATRALSRLWARVDPVDPLASWRADAAAQALRLMTAAQLAAAGGADGYVEAALAAQDVTAEPAGRVEPGAFAGIASDGRPLDSLLEQPAFDVAAFIADGMPADAARAAGSRHLARIVATQVADAARVATGVATVASQARGYVRMLTPPSCSRCVVLAGKFYRSNSGFSRHPLCDCVHIPAAENLRGEVTSPRAYFDSLDAAEQDRVFTKAGAQAIRDGADVGQVVNARRGARGLTPAGARLTGAEARALRGGPDRGRLARVDAFGHRLFVTTEGTTTRGLAGTRLGARETGVKRAGARYRSAKAPRLMPESIYEIAGNRDEALRLLRRNGYITGGPARRAATAVRQLSFADRIGAAASERDALAAARFGLDRRPRPTEFTTEMARAANTYTGTEYDAVNRYLRGQTLPYGYEAADVAPTIADLDRGLAASTLDREVVTYRGVRDATAMFGGRLAGNLTGLTWREEAYVSTTARARKAAGFASSTGKAPVVMRILVPKGTHAIEASGMELEAELVLARGRDLRVVADRGIDPDGVRHIDVEVLP